MDFKNINMKTIKETLEKHRLADDSLPHWITMKHAELAVEEYTEQLTKELEQAKSFAPEVWGRMEEQVKLLKENSKTIAALTEEVEKWSSRTNDLVNGDMAGLITRNKELEKNVLQLATLLSKPQIKFFLSKEETEGIMEILIKQSE
jgi:hypothetical protein